MSYTKSRMAVRLKNWAADHIQKRSISALFIEMNVLVVGAIMLSVTAQLTQPYPAGQDTLYRLWTLNTTGFVITWIAIIIPRWLRERSRVNEVGNK